MYIYKLERERDGKNYTQLFSCTKLRHFQLIIKIKIVKREREIIGFVKIIDFKKN